MIRAALLTVLLLALGTLAALPATRALAGDPQAQRQAVLWGIPLACLFLSLTLFPRLPRPAGLSPGPLGRRLVLLAAAMLAFVLDQSFLAVASLTGWASFAPAGGAAGDGRRLLLQAAWALPACLALSIWGWERMLRGSLYTGWRQRLSARGAAAIAVAVGVVLGLPAVLPGAGTPDHAYLAAAVVTLLCREISYTLLFQRGGGLLVAGLYRGALWFCEAFVVADWDALPSPAFGYVAGGPRFYLARAAAALLAAGLIAGATAMPLSPLAAPLADGLADDSGPGEE